ncbi:MAG: 4-(cytidine 5'-diphospho)-2-C-methyl-D-erythritol kinase [Sulfitobacter sp.]
MTSEVFAPAKINLTLHVTGRRTDGYHLLDSLVVFADVGDRLWFERGKELSLKVTGPFAQGVPMDRGNLVWQAADLAGWTGRITLEKNLPHGAGIGGGSTDAAATLKALGGQADAARLGADVPVCVRSVPTRMRGIGAQLDVVENVPPCRAVLVWPGVGVATPDIFKQLENRKNSAMPKVLPRFQSYPQLITWLHEMRNDLQTTCESQVPEVSATLEALAACDGLGLARMSGSGSTCFGLFETVAQANDAAQIIAREHPEWWVKSCVFGGSS